MIRCASHRCRDQTHRARSRTVSVYPKMEFYKIFPMKTCKIIACFTWHCPIAVAGWLFAENRIQISLDFAEKFPFKLRNFNLIATQFCDFPWLFAAQNLPQHGERRNLSMHWTSISSLSIDNNSRPLRLIQSELSGLENVHFFWIGPRLSASLMEASVLLKLLWQHCLRRCSHFKVPQPCRFFRC